MAEGSKKYSDTVKNLEKISDNTLGQYFDNNAHTIFDDIISPKLEAMQLLPKNDQDVCKLSIMSEMSEELLKDDNSFNDVKSEFNVKDLHSDGWIPCEHTQKVLRSMATSTFSNNLVDRENLTMPGISIQDLISNTKITLPYSSIKDDNFPRNTLTATDVTQDERGLRNLIQAGCYGAAIDLTGRLLAVYGQGYGKINHVSKHTPHSLQLWYTRLALLLKLKRFDILKIESAPFGNLDKPDMYFTFYPELYGTRHGSMASFAFRLLLAEIPSCYGRSKEVINNLYKLLSVINQILKNLEAGLAEEGGNTKHSKTSLKNCTKLWVSRKSRVQISIINHALMINNFKLVINILEELSLSTSWTNEQSNILTSALGRVYLLLGDFVMAEKIFLNVKNGSPESYSVRELVDRGLMAVAQNSYQESYNYFNIASAADSSNITLINNMAVCLLYTGQLKTAVQLLENAVNKNPVKSLQERILLNLSTLYELHITHSKKYKLHLLELLNKYKGDFIDTQCLKLG